VFSRNAVTSDAVATQDLSHNSPNNPPNNSLGALLRDARARKGLSPGDLAQSLNLDLRIVELIEANRLDEAPEPIYVRAYLKHWASLLDTDAAQLLAAFEAQRTINPRADSLNTHARAPLDVMSSRKTTHSTHHNPRARGGRLWGWLATLLIIAGALTVAALALPSAWQQRIGSLIGFPQSQNTSLISPPSSAEQAPIAIEIPMSGAVNAPNASAPAATLSPSAPPAAVPLNTITTTNGSTESSRAPLSAGLPPPPPFGAQESPALNSTAQIGRASCRDRV
jgi:cytoskeleton protein RodZ